MDGKTFEVLEAGGPDDHNLLLVVGYPRFLGAEPVYLPYEFREILDRPEGWMGLATFRAWLCRENLTSLTLREVTP